MTLIVLASSAPGAMAQAAVKGRWSTTAPYTMPINPIHAALLHNGKILVVAGSGNCPPSQSGCPSGPPYGPSNGSGAAIYDPVARTITRLTVTWDMFCNGMVVLPDGRVLIAGGTLQYDPEFGQPKASIFDPATNTFSDTQNMAHGRWYPSLVTLGDGRVMVFSGLNETNGATNNAVEFYTVGSGWSQQYLAPFTPPFYPRLHLLPAGTVLYSGWGTGTNLFNPSTTTWTQNFATTNYANARVYGSAVLLPLTPANNYDPKVMILGGDNPATATTEIIDMGAASPKWHLGPKMSQARIEMNAVILPNGKVLALGGSRNDEDTTTPSKNADLYDPATNTFSPAGANAFARLYHSVALLLPDGTVWFTGGNPTRGIYENHLEIYKPAYLFNVNGTLATRPTISSATSSITYANPFTVKTPNAANISSVVLMRNGAVTHAFNMDQRLVGMSFTRGSGSLTVTAPPNGNIAPPGYYMLFLLNGRGVPSMAKFLELSASSSGSIAFVQVAAATPKSPSSSVAVTFQVVQSAGDLNVVAVGWNDTSSSVNSVTDSKGNSYALAVGPTTGTGLRQSIYYAKNIAPGSNTVRVNFNQAVTFVDVRAAEYRGLDTMAPLDVTAGASGNNSNSATISSGSANTRVANELIFGAGMTSGTITGAGTGFTSRIITSADGDIAEDRVVSSTKSYSAMATNNQGFWVMQMATFKTKP
jgi:hypothetical protein